MGKRAKEGVKLVSKKDFNRKTNIIALLLLIYIIVMLISTSKILDRLGEEEIERSITGEASGEVRLTILAATNGTNATAEDTATSIIGEVLTSGSVLKSSQSSFKFDLYHKEYKTVDVQFTNVLSKTIILDIVNSLNEFVSTDPRKITLTPGETVNVKITFYGANPGVHSGVIILKGTGLKSVLPFILDVSSKEISGRLDISIPEQFTQVTAGDGLLVNVNMAEFNPGQVEVVFKIIGSENEEIVKFTQLMNIQHSLNFDKTIELPDNLADGVYILAVENRVGGLVLADSEVFTVGESQSPFIESPGVLKEQKYFISLETFKILILGVIILIVTAFILYAHEVKGMKNEKY